MREIVQLYVNDAASQFVNETDSNVFPSTLGGSGRKAYQGGFPSERFNVLFEFKLQGLDPNAPQEPFPGVQMDDSLLFEIMQGCLNDDFLQDLQAGKV